MTGHISKTLTTQARVFELFEGRFSVTMSMTEGEFFDCKGGKGFARGLDLFPSRAFTKHVAADVRKRETPAIVSSITVWKREGQRGVTI